MQLGLIQTYAPLDVFTRELVLKQWSIDELELENSDLRRELHACRSERIDITGERDPWA